MPLGAIIRGCFGLRMLVQAPLPRPRNLAPPPSGLTSPIKP